MICLDRFGANEEELLRDRLPAGCCVDRIREKLLLESNQLTLADALKIAQSAERAMQESDLLGAVNKQLSAAEVGQVRSSQAFRHEESQYAHAGTRRPKPKLQLAAKGESCDYCGGSRHDRKQSAVSSHSQQNMQMRQNELLILQRILISSATRLELANR